MKNPRYYCEITGCKKTFRNELAFEDHVKNDHKFTDTSDQKQFNCPTCSKSLSTKQSLKEHIYTHTGERPYKCSEPGCEMYFRQSSQLSNHKKAHMGLRFVIQEMPNIDLEALSKKFPMYENQDYVMLKEPFSVNDAHLPPITGGKACKLRILDELLIKF